MFVYLIDDITRNLQSTSATQGGTRLYTKRLSSAKLLPHYGAQRLITAPHTSDKVAHYSIYRPRKDERLSWLTYSGRLTQIMWSSVSYRWSVGRKVRRSNTGVLRASTQPTVIWIGCTRRSFSIFPNMFIVSRHAKPLLYPLWYRPTSSFIKLHLPLQLRKPRPNYWHIYIQHAHNKSNHVFVNKFQIHHRIQTF